MSTIINIQKSSNIKVNGTHINGNSKAVFCITTGEFFGSLSDAAHHIKASVGTMCCAMKHRKGVFKGMKWCYVSEINEHLDELATDIRANIEKALAYDALMAKINAIKAEETILAQHEAKIAELRDAIKKLDDMLTDEMNKAYEVSDNIECMKSNLNSELFQ
jgi:septal ring factor EnvC (AmiA/AmiB activator)